MDAELGQEVVKDLKAPTFENCDYVLTKTRLTGCVRKSFNDGRWEDWTTGESGELINLVGKGEKF
ncbi:MAG: hypothetical protein HN353_10440 [Bdellovibrionales bacterium]|nr:hypothetical protein [Bdellovibrionales bacterium]MBT3524711.1 hypothetical protein [Bdellovibrionales bacterium]MBT7669091.1 hypothetical protein [Bdellovibrionales bacterium]